MQLAATVILFHPDTDVIENINSYIEEVNALYIIDNSEQKDAKILMQLRNLSPKCKILDNPSNLGIARALNQAVELSIEDGYEWLLTMDQDSLFEDKTFFNAFQIYNDKNKVAVFSPEIHADGYNYLRSKTIKYTIIKDIAYTSGCLINLNICKKVDMFNEKLFIDAVDTDYCLKLMKRKELMIRINGAILTHKVGIMKIINLPLNIKKILNQHSALRHYYITRNHTYILFKYLTVNPKIVLQNYYRVINKFVFALLFQKDRMIIAKYTFIGLFHWLTNRYGKFQ